MILCHGYKHNNLTKPYCPQHYILRSNTRSIQHLRYSFGQNLKLTRNIFRFLRKRFKCYRFVKSDCNWQDYVSINVFTRVAQKWKNFELFYRSFDDINVNLLPCLIVCILCWMYSLVNFLSSLQLTNNHEKRVYF